MDKNDLTEIKKIVETALETHLASVQEDIADLAIDTSAMLAELDNHLTTKIDRIDTKLTKFEEHEIDKRLQLEVRVGRVEKHLDLPAQSRS